MNKYNFSDRMKILASLVIPGGPAADIGTDHGFVPIDLLAENKVPYAILTDINEGPLKKAKGNLDRVGILPQFYELRKGDGLIPVKNNEVLSVIIAGMGAETIVDILSWDLTKTKSFKRLILQPRKRSFLLRKWLYENGFSIIAEKLVDEDGKICEVLAAEPSSDLCNDFSKIDEIEYYLPSLMRSEALFGTFLDDFIRKTEIVIDNMHNSNSTAEIIEPWKNRLSEALKIKENL